MWDAAFELSKHRPVGFDLHNAPFGVTKYYSNLEQNIRYSDIADGLIFYKPFYQFAATIGIPNVVDDDFLDELLNRSIIVSDEGSKRTIKYLKSPENSKKNLKEYYNNVRTFDCENYRPMKSEFKKWLK